MIVSSMQVKFLRDLTMLSDNRWDLDKSHVLSVSPVCGFLLCFQTVLWIRFPELIFSGQDLNFQIISNPARISILYLCVKK